MVYAIRRMEKEDLHQVAEIDREVFPTQWPPPNYRQELNNKIAHYIVAYDTNKKNPLPAPKANSVPPGFLARFTPWRKRDEKRERESLLYRSQYIIGFSGIWMMVGESHITNIAVRERYQRQGIGELLLIATIDLSIEQKAESMTLEVRESNKIAQNLYGKYGFAQTGLRRGYYLDNREDAIIMSTETMKSPTFQENLERLRESLSKKLGTLPT